MFNHKGNKTYGNILVKNLLFHNSCNKLSLTVLGLLLVNSDQDSKHDL